jgi:hypothetical protein
MPLLRKHSNAESSLEGGVSSCSCASKGQQSAQVSALLLTLCNWSDSCLQCLNQANGLDGWQQLVHANQNLKNFPAQKTLTKNKSMLCHAATLATRVAC